MALHLAWAVFRPQNLLQTINPTAAYGSKQNLPSSLDTTKLFSGACRRQAHGDAGRRIRRACTITRRSEIASTGAALSIEASTLTPSPRFTSIISWIAEKNRTVLVCHRTSKAGNTSPAVSVWLVDGGRISAFGAVGWPALAVRHLPRGWWKLQRGFQGNRSSGIGPSSISAGIGSCGMDANLNRRSTPHVLSCHLELRRTCCRRYR